MTPVVSVTYAGVDLGSEVTHSDVSDFSDVYNGFFALKAPTTGSNSLTVTITGDGSSVIGAILLSGPTRRHRSARPCWGGSSAPP